MLARKKSAMVMRIQKPNLNIGNIPTNVPISAPKPISWTLALSRANSLKKSLDFRHKFIFHFNTFLQSVYRGNK